MADQKIEDKSKPTDDPVTEIKDALTDAEGALIEANKAEEVLLGELEGSVQTTSQVQQNNTVSPQLSQSSGSSVKYVADSGSVPAASTPNLKTLPDKN